MSLSVLYIQRTIHGIPLSEIVRTLLYRALHLNPPVVLALPGSEVFVTILTSRVSCIHLFWGIFWSALGFPICILPLVSLFWCCFSWVFCILQQENVHCHCSISISEEMIFVLRYFLQWVSVTQKLTFSSLLLPPSHLSLIVLSFPQLRKTLIPAEFRSVV